MNSIVWSAHELNNIYQSVEAYNSIIKIISSGGALGAYVQALSAYNCILISSNCQLKSNSVAYNCIGINNNSMFSSVPHENCIISSFSNVFEIFDGSTFTFDEPFILTEEIATSFLGTDGTQVGIYGGTMPYDPRPSYQIVKQYDVPNKSDNEGNLNVGIEIYPEAE